MKAAAHRRAARPAPPPPTPEELAFQAKCRRKNLAELIGMRDSHEKTVQLLGREIAKLEAEIQAEPVH